MIQQKVEIRFEKGEAVRFISHHDLMRAFQRAVRRAGLPVRLTEGFNPRPRIIFPAALEVGVLSLDEVAEIEFTQWIPLVEVNARLRANLPPGIVLGAIKEVHPSRRGSQPLRFKYRIELHPSLPPLSPESLQTLLRSPTLPYRRARRADPKDLSLPKELDLRAGLVDAALAPDGALLLELKPGPSGGGRPLEFLSLLTDLPEERLRSCRVVKLETRLEYPPPPIPPTPPKALPPSPNPTPPSPS